MKLKKSSLITKLVIGIIVVYSMVTLISVQNQLNDKQAEGEALEQQIAEVQQANRALQQDIEALDTDEGIEDVAREQLGLVTDGEIVFYDNGD